MKKLVFGLIATVMITCLSFGQNKVALESSVTMKEYESSDQSIQRMADLLNSGFGSLKGLVLNGNSNNNYEAIVMFSLDSKAKTSNSLILAPKETQTEFTSRGSCVACGISSGISCYKKIKAYMEANNLTEIDLHVSIGTDGCGHVNW
jgi:hypothetical protein